ncbi:hypothetical protein Hanom_Chr12g01144871 [Helianthus anomalus]
MTYQLPHSAITLTLGRSVGSSARNCSSAFERTCSKKQKKINKVFSCSKSSCLEISEANESNEH